MFSVLNLHVHIRTAYLNSSLHWVLSATFFVLLYSIAYFSWHNIIFIFSPYFKTRGQQTMAHGPYLALCLFLWRKLHWNTAMLIHLYIESGYFHSMMADLSRCHREYDMQSRKMFTIWPFMQKVCWPLL